MNSDPAGVPAAPPHLVVTAAVVEVEGRVLLARRLDGTHLAGTWEFPGGKCEPGETLAACLAREMMEELGVVATVHEEILTVRHPYPGRVVELHFFACTIAGEPRPLLGQQIRWVPKRELRALEFPDADRTLIERLAAGT